MPSSTSGATCLAGRPGEAIAFLTGYPPYRKIALPGGRVAQGSERFLDTEEVRGSSPRAPTIPPVALDCTRLLSPFVSKGSAVPVDCTGLHPNAPSGGRFKCILSAASQPSGKTSSSIHSA